MPRLETPRLVLIPGSIESLRAELESNERLGEVIGATIPPSWPPELYDKDAINWTIRSLESGHSTADWTLYYIALKNAGGQPTLIGGGGYKGQPDDTGTVEIGYAVLPEFRRRGFAREAVQGMLEFAFSDPRVTRVIAHTLRELIPSQGVLTTTGFDFVGPGNDPSEPDAIQYELTREKYAGAI